MAIEVKKDNPHEVTVGTENLQLCWRLLPLLPSTRQALWGSRTQQPAGCSAVHCQPLLEAHAGAGRRVVAGHRRPREAGTAARRRLAAPAGLPPDKGAAFADAPGADRPPSFSAAALVVIVSPFPRA